MTSASKIILSVCDHSGAWSRPYAERGYTVLRVDPKHWGHDHGGRGLTREIPVYGPAVRVMSDGGLGVGLTAGAFAAAVERRMGRHRCDANAALRELLEGFGMAVPGDATVRGALLAPPCTDFASSGARWWAAKDADGRTAESVAIVRDCLAIRDLFPAAWWVLENPVGRLARLVPALGAPRLYFDPCDYAGFAGTGEQVEREAYTKRTVLYGDFNANLSRSPVEPVMIEKTRKDGTKVRGSWQWANLGGKSERTKELRSVTPTGFARAFALANP